MPAIRSVAMLLLGAAMSQAACGDPAGPTATEPLVLARSSRVVAPGERLPVVEVAAFDGAVRFQVDRENRSCYSAEARVGRGPAVLTIVAHVYPSPNGLCDEDEMRVLTYSGIITDIAPGQYFVRIFERFGTGSPRLLHTRSVTAGPSGGS